MPYKTDETPTDYAAETQEAMQLLEGDSYIPVTREPVYVLTRVVPIDTLDELKAYMSGDCFLRLSRTDGRFYLHLVGEG